jgi:hypothetical protein
VYSTLHSVPLCQAVCTAHNILCHSVRLCVQHTTFCVTLSGCVYRWDRRAQSAYCSLAFRSHHGVHPCQRRS